MRIPDNLKLSRAKNNAIAKERVHRVSDFLTDEEQDKLTKANIKGKKKSKQFDKIDAYTAEILGRFGYDTYLAWQAGTFPADKMNRMLAAERVRERAKLLTLEAIVISAVAGANNPTKSGHAPKSLKTAINILKKEQEAIGGK